MGIPQHYSLELPDRCLTLLNEIMPMIRGDSTGAAAQRFPGRHSGVRSRRAPHMGVLSTTFLLAMATPMIGLPVERIFKAAEDGAYIDDREIDTDLAEVVGDVLRKGRLSDTEFFKPGAWRFADPPHEGEKLGGAVPEHLAALLDQPEAVERAASLETGHFIRWLRNALAHGGVYYLDERGRSTYGQEAKMLMFVSAKYDSPRSRNVVALRLLRIGEADFEGFLRAWANWLIRSGVWRALVAEAA